MKLDKVGDCLRYGLTREIFVNRRDFECKYLRAALVYLILYGYIAREDLPKIQALFPFEEGEAENLRLRLERIVSFVMSKLKETIRFESLEELTKQLNEFEMPEWIYEDGGKLLQTLPDAYLVDDMFYYIDSEEGGLRCADCSGSEILKETKKDDSMILSHKYSHIMGFDVADGVFYLSVKGIKNVYAEYYVDSGQEMLIHKKCIGMIDGRTPIIEADGYLEMKAGGEWQYIKKTGIKEQYEVIRNKIYASPKHNFPTMFVPYWIHLNGEVRNVSYQEAKRYLWGQIQNEFLPFSYLKKMIRNVGETESGKEENFFTLSFIREFIDNNCNPEKDECARRFYFLVNTLAKYLPQDMDVLEYFYIIMEASNRYERKVNSGRLSEQLYWKIEEMDACDELGTYIYNLEEFRKKLLEAAYWDDERIEEEKIYCEPQDKIGYFEICNGKVRAYSVDINCGVCIGSLMIMPERPKRGIVAYNMEKQRFEIQYCRLMNPKEMQEIIKEFNLQAKQFCVMIETEELLDRQVIYDW